MHDRRENISNVDYQSFRKSGNFKVKISRQTGKKNIPFPKKYAFTLLTYEWGSAITFYSNSRILFSIPRFFEKFLDNQLSGINFLRDISYFFFFFLCAFKLVTRRRLVAKLKKGNSTFCRKSHPRKFLLPKHPRLEKKFLKDFSKKRLSRKFLSRSCIKTSRILLIK